MVFNRVVSLLAVGLVVVGSLENSWFVGVIRLSCVWIEVHSFSTCCWVSSFRPHPLHIVFVIHIFVVGLDFNHSSPCREYCSCLLLG